MDYYLLKCTLHDFLFLLGLPIAVGLLLLTTDFGHLFLLLCMFHIL